MKYRQEVQRGKLSETAFANLYKNSFFSTANQNIKEHWDIGIPYENVEWYFGESKKNILFDVKGLKKISRSNEIANDLIHWIELTGVTGYPGSIYGMADYFVFETFNTWIIVDKKSLQNFVEEKCKNNEFVNSSSKALYKKYTRPNKNDVITLVKTEDLKKIATVIQLK